MSSPHRLPRAAGLLVCALALAGCQGTRTLAHPTVRVETSGGVELGASTSHGLIFLGRTARSGDVDITVWYGDGPSVERAVIEPVTAEFCTAEAEIRLPSVPMAFDDPAPGERLVVIGRSLMDFWEAEVLVQAEPRIEGLLVNVPPELDGFPDQIGAGVYRKSRDKGAPLVLIGLVSGRVQLDTRDGPREYLTVLGPRDLWPLVTLRRERDLRPDWVYREDIL